MSQPAPSEYFEGIDFNYSFYTNTGTGGTSLDLDYINSNYLKNNGNAFSTATSTQFEGPIIASSLVFSKRRD